MKNTKHTSFLRGPGKLFLLLCFLLTSITTFASHYRYGNISWSRINSTTRNVTFTVTQAWRMTAFSGVAVGNTVNSTTTLNFGDGGTASIILTVTSVDVANDWFAGTATITHTYAGTATSFNANYASSARIGSPLQNNTGGAFRCETIVNLVSGNNGSPVSTLPAIVNLPVGQTAASFNVPAIEPDGQTMTYALATATQTSGTNPAGLAINSSTGAATFNTVGKTVGQYWSGAFVITDASGSTTIVDFLMQIVTANTPPIFDYSITPANNTVYNINAGQNVSFNVKALDVDPGSTVTLSAVGQPTGVSFSPSLPTTANPVTTNFSFTPTSAQLGVYVITFVATRNGGIQTNTSVTINVNANPQFIAPTKAQGVSYVILSDVLNQDVITAANPNPSVSTQIVSASIPGGASLSPSVPTAFSTTPSTTMNWTPTAADFGPHTVSFTANDANSRTATRSYTLEVNTLPAFASTPVTTATACQAYTYNVVATDANIPYGDDVEIEDDNSTLPSWLTLTMTGNGTATISGTPGAGDAGTYHIVLSAADFYHHSTGAPEQEFDLVVGGDHTAPTIAAPADVNTVADNGTCSAANVALGNATASDNCGGVTVTNDAPATFPVGTTTVTWTATDGFNNSATATQTVTVNDDQNPTIAAPANVTVNADNGACAATNVALGDAATGDNCGVNPATNDAPASYPVGTTTVTWAVTDIHGNSATATQTVTVNDNQNPTISAPANVTVNADNGACAATNVALGDATTGDNCGVNPATNDAPASYPVGTTTVTWTVTDIHGNSATATQTVTVVDNQNPTISAPGNVTVNADNGTCAATNVALGNATTGDNCGVNPATNNAPASYTVGTTTVTWTVTDIHGNSSTATQTVTVVDNQKPTITAPANVTVNADNGACAATNVALGAANTADNCGVASTTNNGPVSYPVGTTTVTWTVTDIHGNSATATQTVTVVDNQKPIANCRNYTLNLSGGAGSITVSNINNGSTDNCGIASMSVSPTNFTCANAGSNTVTLKVTDIHGNVSTCNATVTVQYQPTSAIVVTPANNTYTGGIPTNIYLGYGPQSATVTANVSGGTGFTYSWSPAAGLSCTSCQSPVFTPTAAGNYTYTVVATNSNGCSTTSTVSFCVLDIRVTEKGGAGKVYLCHAPPGNPSNTQTLSISVNAVPSHLTEHSGDRLGSCNQSCGARKGSSGDEHIDEIIANVDMKIYPNPSTGMFVVELPDEVKGGEVIIMDMQGKTVKHSSFLPDSKLNMDMGDAAKGIYMIQVMNGNNMYRARIVIQ